MRDETKPPALEQAEQAAPIRTRPAHACHICGGEGEVAYAGLRDRLFGAPGEWTLKRCKDRGCGLLWLDPMPIEEDLPRLYKTYYTHEEHREKRLGGWREAVKQSFWTSSYGPPKSRPRLTTTILRLTPLLREGLALQVYDLRVVEGGRLLEVGCGSGATLARLSALGWTCEGVDFDEKAVALARSRGLEVHRGSLHDQMYAEGSFDAVVMNHVLEHVPDPRALLVECLRILKPGGRLVCITPNADSWSHSIFKWHWRGLEPPRHLHVFNISSLQRLLREMDWEEVKVQSSVVNTGLIAWASSRLRKFGAVDTRSRSTRWRAMWMKSFRIAARVRHLGNPWVGDEVVLRAAKIAG